MIVGGTDPMQSADRVGKPCPLLEVFQRGVAGGVDEVVEGMRTLAGSITPQYEQRLRKVDPKAMVALLEEARRRPSFADILPQLEIPCLLYAGDGDEGPFENGPRAAQKMPRARFFSLSGLNHVGASAAVELILPEVRRFLSNVGGPVFKTQGRY